MEHNPDAIKSAQTRTSQIRRHRVDLDRAICDNRYIMKTAVEKIAEQVKALPKGELEEFLSWLADYDESQADDWDKEIERDTSEDGSLNPVLKRVRADITAGRTKPLA